MDDLDRNISTQYYERRLAAQRESSTLPVPYTGQADPLEYIKNPMVAEFMGFHRDTNYSESELEQAIIHKNAGKLGKDFPAAFIYHFSGISASSYPRWSVKYSSENII